MTPRSFAIDSYIRESERTVIMIRRPDGRVGAHDLRTGELLGILDRRDEIDDDAPAPFFQGLLFALTALVVVGFVALICFNAGRYIALH